MKRPIQHHRPAQIAEGAVAAEHHLPKDLGELAHLLFEWPIRQSPRLALPFFLLVAALLQAGIMILFSISYTSPTQNTPFSPQVYFIPPDSSLARQIAPWLAANDPGVFSPQHAAREALPAPPPLKYRPSYEDPPPPLRPMPEDKISSMEPPMIPTIPEIRQQRVPSATASSSSLAIQTVVQWQDQLASRRLLPMTNTPPLPLPQTSKQGIEPTLYEVEVSAEGLPLHCVLLDSSGDPASDEAGSVWIHSARFQPVEQSSWGRVQILWGTSSHTAATNTQTSATP